MRIASLLIVCICLLNGCKAPTISWQAAPPESVAVRGSVESNIKANSMDSLEWRVTPVRDWVKSYPTPGGVRIAASPPLGASGQYSFQFQARRGSENWSNSLAWNLSVTPRQLPAVVKVLGDDGCAYSASDSQTDQLFTGGSRTFVIDFGRTFNIDDITGAQVWVDSADLNNTDVECRQGNTPFCPDHFRIEGTSADWSPGNGVTTCDVQNPGETRGFDAIPANRTVLERIAANTLHIIVEPSRGDDCLVSKIVVVVKIVER